MKYRDYRGSLYHAAGDCGHLEIVKFLEDEYNWDIYEINVRGSNISMFAANKGHLNIIEHLHENHKYDFTLKNNHGITALTYAKSHCKHHIVSYLEKKYPIEYKIEKKIDEYILSLENENRKLKRKLEKQSELIKQINGLTTR